MMKTICFDCGQIFEGGRVINTCKLCGGPLVGSEKMVSSIMDLPLKYGLCIDDYFGNTSLKQVSNNLWIKLEGENPTGSFKDRGTLYELLFAKDNSYDQVICASTGNMAVSVGYFCEKMNMKGIILIPSSTPQNRIDTLRKYINIELRLIDDNYDTCAQIAENISKENPNILLVGDYLIRRIGQETCGKEIAAEEETFDYIFCPIGNGTFFNGVVQGFLSNTSEEKKERSTFVGVQGMGCDPLYQAWISGEKRKKVENPQTIGEYFKVGNPGEGNIVMKYVDENKYLMDMVNDNQMKQSKKELGKKLTISTNYTSASVFASYQQLFQKWKISCEDKVLLVLTGR